MSTCNLTIIRLWQKLPRFILLARLVTLNQCVGSNVCRSAARSPSPVQMLSCNRRVSLTLEHCQIGELFKSWKLKSNLMPNFSFNMPPSHHIQKQNIMWLVSALIWSHLLMGGELRDDVLPFGIKKDGFFFPPFYQPDCSSNLLKGPRVYVTLA